MKFKSFLASLLVLCSLLTTALPAAAVTSSFQDVQDSNTAIHADILRLMGAVSGSGNNQFNPSSHLTRAEFCVMAVHIMGKSHQVPLHTTRTIFQDVTARHWARGFINLAASTTIGGDDSKPGNHLISGTGDGRFLPNANITFGQAVTILTRMLGYRDDQVGSVWPTGYLNLAQSLSLTKNLSLSADTPITRAQAAQLFVNLLSTKTTEGNPYYTALGTPSENVILMAVNVEADDHSQGAIRTSKGTFFPAAQGIAPTALVGKRGTLILNSRNEIVTFLPDESTNITVTLSGNATATGLTAADGTRYSIGTKTPVFTNNADASEQTYSDVWLNLYSGSRVTLFLSSGKVIGLYYSAVGSSSQSALIVQGSPNRAAFLALTRGVENYTILKNNQIIRLSDIKPYDVVTYDSILNALIVSDLRLTCVYESAQPNAVTPSTIHALGYDFPVLDSALTSINQFTAGKLVTMLLTADGRIAGLINPDSTIRSTAIGLASENSVEMLLPAGGTIKLTSSNSFSSYAQNQVVSFSSSKAGIINPSPLWVRSAPGDFDIPNLRLGQYTVAAGASLFEQIPNGPAVPIQMNKLGSDLIDHQDIYNFHLNSSGMVDLIIFNSITGDSYTYGRYIPSYEPVDQDEFGNAVYDTVPYFDSRANGMFQLKQGTGNLRYGEFIGTIIDHNKRIVSLLKLQKIEGISRSDFFLADGQYYVKTQARTYLVSDSVEAFLNDTKTWFTGNNILNDVRAYSDDMTIYIDPHGEKVRIITIK